MTIFCSAAHGLPKTESVDGIRIVRAGGRHGVYRAARGFFAKHGHEFDLVIDEVNTRPFLTPQFVKNVPIIALIHQVCREIWWHELPPPVAALGRFILEPAWLRCYRDVPTITVSASSEESLRSYGLRRISVVSEGLRLPESHDRTLPKASSPTLIFVGRLKANKRPHHAIKAYRIIRRSIPEARLWIVGGGPMEAGLKRKAPPGTAFLGRVPEAKKFELMAQAHLLLATSVREGWGLVVSESAAVGTPAVAYDVPGLRDSVSATGGGLVPPNPSELARAVIRRLGSGGDAAVAEPEGHGAKGWPTVATEFCDAIQGYYPTLARKLLARQGHEREGK